MTRIALLRAYLLFIICFLGLGGCAHQAGIKNYDKPLVKADLSKHHVYAYHTVKKMLPTTDWWMQFKDPLLNQLMTVGLRDSPTMRMAESRLRKAQYLAAETETNLWPYVDASGYLERERFSQFGLVPPPFNGRTFNIGQVGLNFNYQLDFWGKNRQTLAAAVSEACASAADVAEARLVLSASIAHAYFNLQNSKTQAKLAQLTYQTKKQLLNIVGIRGKRGIESDIPIKVSLADVQATKIKAIQYQQAEKLAQHQLAALLGKNAFETDFLIKDMHYRKKLIALPNHLPANVLAKRPDVLASRLRTEAAAHQINVAKAYFFPDINLMGLFSFQSVRLNHLFEKRSQNNAISGAFDLPIFDAGYRRANLGVQYAEYDAAVNQYNATILTALKQIADQLIILKSVNSQWDAQRSSLAAIEQNVRLVKSRYRHGIVDYAQVLQAEDDLFAQQSTQVDLQTYHQQALAGLMVALGGSDLMMRGKQ